MVPRIKSAAYGITAAVIFAAGWQANGWRLGLNIEQERAGYAQSIATLARKAADLQERNLREVARVEDLRRDLADSVAQAAALRQREAEVVERYIDREVIRYVQTENADRCGLSADGVRLHDAAATGTRDRNGVSEAPEPASGADGAAVAARNAEVLATVARNYQTCRMNQRQLESLQDWARKLRN